ncbi:fermitin family homolog 3-like [Chamaea fasciata]|uniref:fermitin family homolog 3-like n=1 Tax=Chamaea fasciata TaxID=190680 RepID=UPI00336AD82C
MLRPLLSPKFGGRDPPGPPRSPPGNALRRWAGLHARWLDVGRSLMEQGVAEDEELLLRFKYPCAMGLDPQDGRRVALLQQQARGELLAEEIECTEEQGVLFAALQYQIEGEEWGDPPEPPQEPQDLDTALDKLELSLGGGGTPGLAEEPGASPELEEELEIHRPSPWPFRGSRPTRALLSGSSLSLWTPPGTGGPHQQLDLRGCEVTPEVDLGAQKFGLKLRVGTSETLLRCRDAPQFARWFCGIGAASRGGRGGVPSGDSGGPGGPGDAAGPPRDPRPASPGPAAVVAPPIPAPGQGQTVRPAAAAGFAPGGAPEPPPGPAALRGDLEGPGRLRAGTLCGQVPGGGL